MGIHTQSRTVKWQFEVLPYTMSEVSRYCINDKEWQRFRLTLKGIPTFKKIEMLYLRRHARLEWDNAKLQNTLDRSYQVQIDNYINALKRGGQLNMKLEVVK